MQGTEIVIAAKCGPDDRILSAIKDAGLHDVELYTDSNFLQKPSETIILCNNFPFRYAIHAPIDTFQPAELAELAEGINAEIIVFHDVFWEDEWNIIKRYFTGIRTKICIENVSTIHESTKFMRRLRMGRCLDLEHLQMEAGGVFEEEFLKVMKTASHIHMSGYSFGSKMWHTPIYCSPDHNIYLLDLIKRAGYSGLVVSEARVSYQTLSEFKKLNEFFQKWKDNNS